MINWQDTVMTKVDLQREIPASNGIACLLSVRDMFLCSMTARKQDEISFKAGIKEVVDWSNETCPHDLFGEGTLTFKRVCDSCWQAKLKEWEL